MFLLGAYSDYFGNSFHFDDFHIIQKDSTYEVSSEICGEIKRNKLRLAEVPIRPIYTDYSLSKGQGLLPGIKTFLRLLLSVAGRPRCPSPWKIQRKRDNPAHLRYPKGAG